MKNPAVPDAAVRRVSLYVRTLERLARENVATVSSGQLARELRLTAAQVRKDLAYFGQFGRPGVGYRVGALLAELRRVLGTDRRWRVALVGAGDLGRALLRYKGFREKGFDIVAAFDVASAKIGRRVGGVPIFSLDALAETVQQEQIRLAILTVPTSEAQGVADRLCRAGIQGILNFAPILLETPDCVPSRPVDLAAGLEQLAFHVNVKNRQL